MKTAWLGAAILLAAACQKPTAAENPAPPSPPITAADFRAFPDLNKLAAQNPVSAHRAEWQPILDMLDQAAHQDDEAISRLAEDIYTSSNPSDTGPTQADFLIGILARMAYRVEDLPAPPDQDWLSLLKFSSDRDQAGPTENAPLWPIAYEGGQPVLLDGYPIRIHATSYAPDAALTYLKHTQSTTSRRYPERISTH